MLFDVQTQDTIHENLDASLIEQYVVLGVLKGTDLVCAAGTTEKTPLAHHPHFKSLFGDQTETSAEPSMSEVVEAPANSEGSIQPTASPTPPPKPSADVPRQNSFALLLRAIPLVALGALFGVALKPSETTVQPVVVEAAPPVPEPPPTECDEIDASCEVGGVAGRCLRGGWCMPAGPGCIHDIDCEDGNTCTAAACEGGQCVWKPVEGSCQVGHAEGVCQLGICEEKTSSCVVDSDCPKAKNPCAQTSCSATGQCESQPKSFGTTCRTQGGAAGTCEMGVCALDKVAASQSWDINCKTIRSYYGTFKSCDKSLRFLLTPTEHEEARKAIHDRILEEMRYDLFVSLVALPDGGYNIITSNVRSRENVQGLVDPSFVAFTMATYTESTNWKSRNLQIWVSPYTEGWAIPTSGSRAAIDKGKSKSILGMYGVVDVAEYRAWLEKTFYRLKSLGPADVASSSLSPDKNNP